MRKFLIFLILLTFAAPAYAATIYKWVDEKGVVNFTDDSNKVPPAYRDRVEVEEYLREEGTPAPALDMAAKTKEEIKADIYGRDVSWWEEKVRPWKEQLKETIDKFEEARDSFVKQAEGLGPFMFGRLSLTQYQMISSRLVVSNDQMAKYETQITEAKAMLAKLLKEAKETKADPTWLE
jgi:hypothetical protein